MTNPGLSGGRAMLELAERAEKATEPDRLLDANIHWHVKRNDFEADDGYRKASYCYARGGWTLNKADRIYLNTVGVPFYTASLDAAMTLVPEGVRETHIVSFASDEGPLGAAWIEGNAYFERGDAKTSALALVAAALRARAADTPSVKP